MTDSSVYKVLFEDKEMIAVHKASGIATQTKSIVEKDLYTILTQRMGKEAYLGMIHRLDQPVEGIVIFAKTKQAAGIISGQMNGNGFEKEYLAIVHCNQQLVSKDFQNRQIKSLQDAQNVQVVKHYLLKNGKTNTSQIVKAGTPGAKEAVLSYEVIEQVSGYALVRIFLKTGRHHQIRVQLADVFDGIVGDTKYAKSSNTDIDIQNPNRNDTIRDGIALCACKATLKHPKTKKNMVIETKPSNEVFQMFDLFKNQ